MAKIIKKLTKLLNGLSYDVLYGRDFNISINKICYNTKEVDKNDLFICIKGSAFDSHGLINEIINKNVYVVIVNKNSNIKNKIDNKSTNLKNVIILEVSDTRKALCIISKNYFDNAASKLKIIGITGTKGKTTTSFMIKSILEEGTKKDVGLIGSIGCFIGKEFIETNNTTPESFILHEFFFKMLNKGIEYCVMEVSSQSLKYNRVYGIQFDTVIWTNIYMDHIGENEHTDYDDYLNSKLKIFSQTKYAIVNASTNDFGKVKKAIEGNKVVKRYLSIDKKGKDIFNPIENIILFNDEKCLGVSFDFFERNYKLNFPGKHNVENAMLAIGFGILKHINPDLIKKALFNLNVSGRNEVVYKNKEYIVIVDYAHNEIGTVALLNTIKEYSFNRIVVVFGCGGNRSKDRRYGMGKTVSKMADFAIITTDNSRFEKTSDIINDILSVYETKNYIVIEDRKDAIEYAINNHKNGDCILIIGKGHETYNDIMGVKTHFSDKEEAIKIINKNER